MQYLINFTLLIIVCLLSFVSSLVTLSSLFVVYSWYFSFFPFLLVVCDLVLQYSSIPQQPPYEGFPPLKFPRKGNVTLPHICGLTPKISQKRKYYPRYLWLHPQILFQLSIFSLHFLQVVGFQHSFQKPLDYCKWSMTC